MPRMETLNSHCLLSLSLLVLFLCPSYSQLQYNYYHNSCPDVESIVHSAVKKKLEQTFVMAPATLRLFFHDCFVQGCDASVLLTSHDNNAEKGSPGDLSLAGDGFDTVIRAKSAVDSVPGCRHKVSCANILALVTRDVISLSGGPYYAVELGRRDRRISLKASVNGHLSLADFNLNQLKSMFASHGLDLVDLVALSGAHTIDFSHCRQFPKRIHDYNRKTRTDPARNLHYAVNLRHIVSLCPKNVDPRIVVPMDPDTPLIFDNLYYKNLQQGKGLLSSDHALLTSLKSREIVDAFASNSSLFKHVFVSANTKLARVDIKTRKQG
ncbi:Peroxidase 45-like protein [Drosera capensis]